MNRANPKLIILAGALLAITMAFKVVPSLLTTYSQLKSDKESLKQEVIYFQDLVEQEEELRLKAEEARTFLTGIEDSVFDIPQNLFGSEIQSIIRNISGRTGVEVREIRVARVQRFEDWLKVTQELNFEIEQDRILPFLNALSAHRPRLYVRRLTITRSRQQFLGSVAIEAISRR